MSNWLSKSSSWIWETYTFRILRFFKGVGLSGGVWVKSKGSYLYNRANPLGRLDTGAKVPKTSFPRNSSGNNRGSGTKTPNQWTPVITGPQNGVPPAVSKVFRFSKTSIFQKLTKENTSKLSRISSLWAIDCQSRPRDLERPLDLGLEVSESNPKVATFTIDLGAWWRHWVYPDESRLSWLRLRQSLQNLENVDISKIN